MAGVVHEARQRLSGQARSGGLATLCSRHGIDLMVLFGSALQGREAPTDLDLAVRFQPGSKRDILTLLDDLYQLTDLEAVDLLVLNDAGSVARERAMVHGQLLYQASDGIFATEQIAAIMERLDTDHLRLVELELMAE